MEFGYWGIKGRGEPLRWLIAYLGLEVKEYNPETAEAWYERKHTIEPMPNLPYIIDGDFILTETQAIATYLIEKSGQTELLGKNPQDKARVRQIVGVSEDIIHEILKHMVDVGDFKANAEKSTSDGSIIATKLKQLDHFLGDNKYFLDYVTWADFYTVYTCQFLHVWTHSFGLPCPTSKLPHLVELRRTIEGLPKVWERIAASELVPFLPQQVVPYPLHTLACLPKNN